MLLRPIYLDKGARYLPGTKLKVFLKHLYLMCLLLDKNATILKKYISQLYQWGHHGDKDVGLIHTTNELAAIRRKHPLIWPIII